MTDRKTTKSLLQFLQSARAQNRTLIFAGHSLAGALAPTLALVFFNSNGGQLNLKDWSAVYLYPTAGPTPGNADFGKFLSSVFPSVPSSGPAYRVWNQNVWNSIDVVPHAWNLAMLDQVATLYPAPRRSDPTKEPEELSEAIDFAKSLSTEGGKTGAGPYV